MSLESLLRKRKKLELQIRQAEEEDRRKRHLINLMEKEGLFRLSDEELEQEFKRIAQTHL